MGVGKIVMAGMLGFAAGASVVMLPANRKMRKFVSRQLVKAERMKNTMM